MLQDSVLLLLLRFFVFKFDRFITMCLGEELFKLSFLGDLFALCT